MTAARTAAALIIGNEILSGKIADANIPVLAATLRALGVRLERVVMVLDDEAVIAREVRALRADHDLVVTSGGVGPTHDDVTVAAVCAAFGAPKVSAPAMEAMLRSYYGERLTAGHLLMARVPQGARLIQSSDMPWPTVVMDNVWILPGVPQVFAMKMAVLRTELAGGTAFRSRAVFTDLDEGALKPALDQVVARHPEVEVGSYPKWREPRFKTKVTFDSQSQERVDSAAEAFIELIGPGAVVVVDEG
ncbi:MAG: competence/damage-inducible protein A [Myxococcales bacterium]|nr:competence/damage-inducible protein A [Myxococcales bacterium]